MASTGIFLGENITVGPGKSRTENGQYIYEELTAMVKWPVNVAKRDITEETFVWIKIKNHCQNANDDLTIHGSISQLKALADAILADCNEIGAIIANNSERKESANAENVLEEITV